jgi:hypothetical protein
MIFISIIIILIHLFPFYHDCMLYYDGSIRDYETVYGYQTLNVYSLPLAIPFIFFCAFPLKWIGNFYFKKAALYCGILFSGMVLSTTIALYINLTTTKEWTERLFAADLTYSAAPAAAPYVVIELSSIILVVVFNLLLLSLLIIANHPESRYISQLVKRYGHGNFSIRAIDPYKVIYNQALSRDIEIMKGEVEELKEDMEEVRHVDEGVKCPVCNHKFTAYYIGDVGDIVDLECPNCKNRYKVLLDYDFSLGPVVSNSMVGEDTV